MSAWTSANPKKLSCSCNHEYQDATYGKTVRLHNPCKLGTSEVGYRCTVCSKVKSK